MMNIDMQQTVFQIEKLKNVVNVGRSSAYQIFTCPGPVIGQFGTIANPETQCPANDARFNTATTAKTQVKQTGSWIKKALTAFRPQV
jgi:hypothetical protein